MGERMVGREWELSALTDLLDAAAAGRGRGVVLLGDAGIGKTTLAAAFAAEAESTGFAVAWGRCPEAEVVAYWPWRQAFRALGRPFPDIAGAGRAAGFAAAADHLADATADRPTVLIAEDVHLADGPSLALLRFLVGVLPELRCVLVLTTRDNAVDLAGDAADTLRSLPPSVARLTLAGLDRGATGELVAQALGTDAAGEVVDAVHARTGGNPFFVQELARLQAARGTAPLGAPAGVRQVVGRRLARLSQRTHDCLAAAAVLGDETPVDVLADVQDVPVRDVVERLGEAAGARLASLEGDVVRFAHALVREVLYDGLGAVRRSELHLHAGTALIGRCCTVGRHRAEGGLPVISTCCKPTLVEANAGQVAAHFRRAVAHPEAAAPAREFALIAARSAVRRAGYEQAVRFFEWADDPDPAVRLEMGEAQVLAGELAAGRERLRAVARACIDAGDGETAARAVLAMGGGVGGFEVDLSDEEQTRLLERAVELMPAGDSVVRAAALARIALGRAHGRMDETSRALAREAVDMAHRLGDARTEAAALAAWCDTAAGPDFVTERTAESRRMLELADRHGDVTLELLARRLLVVALFEQGDLPAADAQITVYERVAASLRTPFYSWPVPIWRGARAVLDGRLEDAERFLDAATVLAAQAGSGNADLMVFALRMRLAVARGAEAAIVRDVDATMGPLWDDPMVQGYAVYFLTVAGDTDRARRALSGLLTSGLDRITKDAEWLPALTMLGDAARALGERDVVAQVAEIVAPYADLWLVDGIGGGIYGRVGDYLDRFTQFLGRPSPPPRTDPLTGELRRVGATWEVCWQGRSAHVPDSKGLRDLAVLLGRPRTPVSVLDLTGAPSGGDIGPVLDEAARAAYKRRLQGIAEELADDFLGADAAEKLRTERDFLARELGAALGLGGRARVAGDPVERARKAVSMRIGAAVKAIEHEHPALGRHLRAAVRTGRQCAYEPEQEATWHCQF